MFKQSNIKKKEADVTVLFKQAGPLFVALGDENRQHIVGMLLKHPQLSVNQIAAASPLSRPAVSHHLKILQQADILSATQHGTQRMYHLSEGAVQHTHLLETLAKALRECTEWQEQ